MKTASQSPLAIMIAILTSFTHLAVASEHFSGVTQYILDQTPLGKYIKGTGFSGYHDIAQLKYCSSQNLSLVYSSILKPSRSLKIYTNDQTLSDRNDSSLTFKVKDMMDWILSELTQITSILEVLQDPLLLGHGACIAIADFGQTNAESLGLGYMVFDPQIFANVTHMAQTPIELTGEVADESSIPYAMSAVIMHELAHQFQYWSNEPYTLESGSARHLELQADCVAASLVFIKNSSITEEVIRQTFRSLGDFEYNDVSHHGTPVERDLAVSQGINIVRAKRLGFSNQALNSRTLLEQCRSFINFKDLTQGNPWLK